MLIGVLVSINLSSCSKDDEPTPIENDYCDAVVDGIGYHITNLEELTVSVVAATSPNTYTGSISIPSKVNINGKDFTVTAIEGAFNQTTVTAVALPNTIQQIGTYSFYKCSKLSTITIPSSVTEILAGAFYQSNLESVTIPSSVERIGLGCFESCDNLKKVTIEDSATPLKVIVNSYSNDFGASFEYSVIETFYLGRDIITNQKDAYSYTLGHIEGLQSVTFGNNVTETSSLLSSSNTSNLKSITCNSVVPPIFYDYYVSNECLMTAKVYVPASALQSYKDSEHWSKFWNLEAIK